MRLVRTKWICLMAGLWICLNLGGMTVRADTIYDSSNVSFSSDGHAWTTNAGEQDYEWYPLGRRINTGIESSLRSPAKGQHYYRAPRYGVIPIKYWQVEHRTGSCVHNSYPPKGVDWHGLDFARRHCGRYYYSGWMPYCADCGEKLVDMFFYMSDDTAKGLKYLEAGTGMDYYYLCPWCSNLEMGSDIPAHLCQNISWNRYKVRYDANTVGIYGGYMEDSIHFYNNTNKYDGTNVTPIKTLSSNAYFRIGYVFAGWNTMPDGSGMFYEDEAEILNLTDENYEPGKPGGVVTLYAMWQPASGVLHIDPMGGTYENKEYVSINGQYMEQYEVKAPRPPKGYRVSFDTMGGESLESILGQWAFVEWKMAGDFGGVFGDNKYIFKVPDGNEDILQAQYEHRSIELPLPVKSGYSFGGWYYDNKYQKPAGYAGDKIVPSKDMTLYAQWVDLKLTAVDNYKDNDGKGAVDLSWALADGRDKQYIIYQSRDLKNWQVITGANEIGMVPEIKCTEMYSGKAVNYTVPYTGIYRFWLSGAQGGNYGNYQGGAGGTLDARVWLAKGEQLTFQVGGQNGYYGGGMGTVYGRGGGYTAVSSEQKGLFLIAGGGGGASLLGAGGAGGSTNGLRSDNWKMGEDGQAGGGAGGIGGLAGEVILHHHTASCYRDVNKDILTENADARFSYKEIIEEDGDDTDKRRYVIQYGSPKNLIAVDGATTLELEVLQRVYYGIGSSNIKNSYLTVYDQNGNRIYRGGNHSEKYEVIRQQSFEEEEDGELTLDSIQMMWGTRGAPEYSILYDDKGSVIQSSGNFTYIPNADEPSEVAATMGGTVYIVDGESWYGTRERYYLEKISIPKGTTGIYIVSEVDSNRLAAHEYYRAMLTGQKKLICGYEEGQILSSKPAYGGSNYANDEYCISVISEKGKNLYDGRIMIQSEQIGYLSQNSLKGVKANDLAAPGMVDATQFQYRMYNRDQNQVRVSWQKPPDYGTEYFHVVEAYQPGGNCKSNITSNVLTTGVRGYYWKTDSQPDTAITGNESYCEEEEVVLTIPNEGIWLHMASVDGAGNIGRTTHAHISMDKIYFTEWSVYTNPLTIEDTDSVYITEDKVYVRSDGRTPFVMNYSAYRDALLGNRYRINEAVFESEMSHGQKIQSMIRIEDEDSYSYMTEGETVISFGQYMEADIGEDGSDIQLKQQFVLNRDAHGEAVRIIPRAGVTYGNGISVYSKYEEDLSNGLTLMGDSEAPLISGMEALENLVLLNHNQQSIPIVFTAQDDLSGVAEFSVEITNLDNRAVETIKPDAQGIIRLDLAEDRPVYSGDFVIKVTAVDHVGNRREETHSTTGFALSAEIERILAPHEPNFRCGESGLLKISVWGYPDRVEVEFPKEMLRWNPELNQSFDYTDVPRYERTETLQFMIPLEMQEAEELPIIVRAYKGNQKLEEHPSIAVFHVEGSILDDIRTRLR